jgi:urease accessory protein UreF
MVMAKKLLVKLRRLRAATNIQKAVRSWRARTRFEKQRRALIYIQRVFKAKREKRYNPLSSLVMGRECEECINNSEYKTSVIARQLRAQRREKAAKAIQAAIRGRLQRKRYQKQRYQIILVQNLWRYMLIHF